MKANKQPIIDFLRAVDVQFVIPVYQRNYDWTTNECKELLYDIIAVEQEKRVSHFIGSIVFIHEGTHSTNKVKELVIIDGQQRLTTINVLYVALYRFAKDNDMREADELYNTFLVNQYAQQESSKLKLKQTGTNSSAFKAIMNSKENEFEPYSNVIENFKFFESAITKDSFKTILNGLKKLIFVEISLERGSDDPQRIFESLNSTGIDLSQSDLIRNYILMDLELKKQQEVFEQIWKPIEENARDLTKQKKSLVSSYIRDYLTLRNKKIPNESKVYVEFKKLYLSKDEKYYQELENIKSLSVHYNKFINPSKVQDSNIKKELTYISRLEINVAFPFLLQVFVDAENGLITNEELLKLLKLIQTYTWRRFVVGLPTNALNKVFMTLYSEVDTEKYYDSIALALIKKRGSAKFPTDEDLKTALKVKDLYNIKPKNRDYMFELLENYNNREFVDTANENITIEHIFPQNPNEDWNKAIPQDDYVQFKEKYVNTLANLTLSGNNGSLSNKSFKDKQTMNEQGGEQGYKYSRLWINDYLKKIDNWTVTNYNKRFDFIYSRFLKIWEYPDVVIPVSENTVEQILYNAESPTNKKLEYFIFENTKVDEEVIAQMYYYVIEKLYEKNAQLLLEAKNIFKTSRNKSDFRSPQELQNGYFFESNLSSDSKFSTLNKLLTLFGLEDELLIKYADNENKDSQIGI